MTVYKVQEKGGYYPAVFIVTGGGAIFCESPAIGFIPRPDLTLDDLKKHLDEMKKDGFTVTENKF